MAIWKPILRFVYISVAVGLTTMASLFASEKAKITPKPSYTRFDENRQLSVDRASLEAQKTAISKISALLKRYRGKAQEPALLFQLAESQQNAASLQFRISHADASLKGGSAKLAQYQNEMRASIEALDLLLKRYPDFDEKVRAIFLRGKAKEELGAKQLAAQDYLLLVRQYPEAQETVPALMSLAQFSTEDGQHAKAISFLEQVEARPETAHFPFALYKLGWSHYNLKSFSRAMEYLSKHVRYFDVKSELEQGLTDSDISLRETTMSDLSLFTAEALEEGKISLSDSYAFLKKNARGDYEGRMYVKFARVLRSHGVLEALVSWKNIILQNEIDRPETFEVVATTFEFLTNRRDYKALADLAKDYVVLYTRHGSRLRGESFQEEYQKTVKLLLATAKDLQALVIKNKNAHGVKTLSSSLASLYDTFTKIVPEQDPRVPAVHFNLAETLFEIRDFNQATEHYRWVITHWNRSENLKLGDMHLKAVNARYQGFAETGVIPKDLPARTLDSNKDDALEPRIQEWIAWVDELTDRFPTKEGLQFAYEANRILYSRSRIVQAIKRLQNFALEFSDSAHAIPSASLVLDTLVKSEDWERTHETTQVFRRKKEFQVGEFGKKLVSLGSDAFTKRVELFFKAKDYPRALAEAEAFLKAYPQGPRREENLSYAVEASFQAKLEGDAERNLDRLLKEFPKSKNAAPALLKRAGLHESRFDFAQSTLDYEAYLAMAEKGLAKSDPSELETIRKKILLHLWLEAQYPRLREKIRAKGFCIESLENLCDQYLGLITLELGPKSESEIKETIQSGLKGEKENRPIWAAAALRVSGQLKFQERQGLLRWAASRWSKLDSMTKLVTLPHLNRDLPEALELSRKDIAKFAPLRPNEKAITRRVELVKELEDTTAKIMDLPWSRLRAQALDNLAATYAELSTGLSNLETPNLPEDELKIYQETIQKLVLPFEEKGQELRRKAFEIAAENSIEDSAFGPIADRFFKDNPSQAKAMGQDLRPSAVSLEPKDLLDRFDPDASWWRLGQSQTQTLQALWFKALEKKQWGRVAFFGQQAREDSKTFPQLRLDLMGVTALWLAGAQGEALLQLSQIRKHFAPEQSARTAVLLAQNYLRGYSRARVGQIVADIQDLARSHPELKWNKIVTSKEEAFTLAYGAEIGRVALEDSTKQYLVDLARSAPNRAQVAWAEERFAELNAASKAARGLASKKPRSRRTQR